MPIPIFGIDISKQKFDVPYSWVANSSIKPARTTGKDLRHYLFGSRGRVLAVFMSAWKLPGLMVMTWRHTCTMPVISSV